MFDPSALPPTPPPSDPIAIAGLVIAGLGVAWAVFTYVVPRRNRTVFAQFVTPDGGPELGVIVLGKDGHDLVPDRRGLLSVERRRVGDTLPVLDAKTRRQLGDWNVGADALQQVTVFRTAERRK
ncbi:MAG: hypothetical protein AAFU73_21510 [Planctomycetota bacterium]